MRFEAKIIAEKNFWPVRDKAVKMHGIGKLQAQSNTVGPMSHVFYGHSTWNLFRARSQMC